MHNLPLIFYLSMYLENIMLNICFLFNLMHSKCPSSEAPNSSPHACACARAQEEKLFLMHTNNLTFSAP